MTKREDNFREFATIVGDHISNYTVPQYGDAPNDQIEQWDRDQCMDSIKRYCNRFATNRRGRTETLRDMAKIAHLASIIFEKLNPTEDEVDAIREGRV